MIVGIISTSKCKVLFHLSSFFREKNIIVNLSFKMIAQLNNLLFSYTINLPFILNLRLLQNCAHNDARMMMMGLQS